MVIGTLSVREGGHAQKATRNADCYISQPNISFSQKMVQNQIKNDGAWQDTAARKEVDSPAAETSSRGSPTDYPIEGTSHREGGIGFRDTI